MTKASSLPLESSPGGSFSAHDAVLEWVQDIAPYGIFTTDSTFQIRSWNQWLTARSGWTAEKLVGQSLLDKFPELISRRIHQRYENALKGEISVLSAALHQFLLPFPTHLPSDSNPYMLQTVRIAPLVIGEQIVGTITIIEDVTEREIRAAALQRQQQHDQMLSQALSVLLQSGDPMRDIAVLFPSFVPALGVDAFFTHFFDPQDKILRLSGSGGILARLKDELVQFSLADGPCGPCALGRQPTVVLDLQENDDPHYRDLRGHGLRFFACFPVAIADQLLGTVSVGNYDARRPADDETKFLSTLVQYLAIAMERIRREAQLREVRKKLQEHAESLELKVHERTARLHDTIAQLESFSYTVAHDLRAPIRALKGYSEVLRDDYGQVLPAEANLVITRMLNASARLDALTRDVLRFSKIARSDIKLASVEVAEVVDELSSYTPELRKFLTVQAPLGTVWAQRTLLQQCLANLFENALKFGSPHRDRRVLVRSERTSAPAENDVLSPHAFNPATFGTVKSSLAIGLGQEPWLRIWVEDNGIGIPDHARSKIFGIFERSVGSEKIEGTGIGLAIVARAMQQMGGSCGVESELGVGSRFWLQLPGRLEPAEESGSKGA